MSKVANPITTDSRLAELNELFGEPPVLLEFRRHPGLPGDDAPLHRMLPFWGSRGLAPFQALEHGELLKLRRPSTQAALDQQSWGLR